MAAGWPADREILPAYVRYQAERTARLQAARIPCAELPGHAFASSVFQTCRSNARNAGFCMRYSVCVEGTSGQQNLYLRQSAGMFLACSINWIQSVPGLFRNLPSPSCLPYYVNGNLRQPPGNPSQAIDRTSRFLRHRSYGVCEYPVRRQPKFRVQITSISGREDACRLQRKLPFPSFHA